MHSLEKIKSDLESLGISEGDTVLMHSSFRSIGGVEGGAEGFFDAFFEVLGESGTLVLPALSYEAISPTQPIFDRDLTPSCVGYLAEYFRTSVPGVVRSMHATHSCCARGYRATELVADHELDLTPVGKNSPFAKLALIGGKILMLGCGNDCNTSMHGVEETAVPPYLLLQNDYDYILRDGDREIRQRAMHHNFVVDGKHVTQKYSRVVSLLPEGAVRFGKVGYAECTLMSARDVWERGHQKLTEDPWFFVDR